MMRKDIFKIVPKILFFSLIIFPSFFLANGFELCSGEKGESQEQEVKVARMYRDVFPLISESDLYCSFFILEGKKEQLDTKIVRTEKREEIVLIREQDVFYINKGSEKGLEPGQVFIILEVGPIIRSPFSGRKLGHIVYRRGKAEIVAVGSNRASARLVKACDQVKVGDFLVPFEEKTGLLGKDLGYEGYSFEAEGMGGGLIYLQNDWGQIGTGNWAAIDIGEEDGIQFGQQLIAYRVSKEAVAPKIIGNLIVVDVQKKTSTVKVLSCSDSLRLGDRARTR